MVDGPFDPELPSPPDWLARDEIALKAWHRVLSNLVGRGLWDPPYEGMIAVLAKSYSWYRELHETVAAAGDEATQVDRDELAALRTEVRKSAASFLQIRAGRAHLSPLNSEGVDAELERLFR